MWPPTIISNNEVKALTVILPKMSKSKLVSPLLFFNLNLLGIVNSLLTTSLYRGSTRYFVDVISGTNIKILS